MAGPSQKFAKDIEGEAPEQIAWGLLEWVRMVEDVRDRNGILDAYRDGLIAASASNELQHATADIQASSVAASGTQRRLAYKLAALVAEMEGRDPGQRNQGDCAWILGTYAECLEAVMGRRRVKPVAAEPQASDGEVEVVAAA
jgi:hypothetical protein